MHGAQLLARPLGEEQAGHLGRHLHHLAACGVAQGQVQDTAPSSLICPTLASTSLSAFFPRLCLVVWRQASIPVLLPLGQEHIVVN